MASTTALILLAKVASEKVNGHETRMISVHIQI
jgi:hypothetical protein